MISWRTRIIACWRWERSQRWRWSIRNSTPCSFGVMGYGSDSETFCRISTSSTSISKPPWARASARILPRTINEDSWVRCFRSSNFSSGSEVLSATHCIRPVPSRSIGKTIFPDLRRLYSQPASSTSSATCCAASLIVIRLDIRGLQRLQLIERTQNLGQRIFHLRHFAKLQKQGILFGARTQAAHGFGPVDAAARRAREQMLIFPAVVVMQVQRADPVLHDFELMLHARADVCVADIEDIVQLQVGCVVEELQALRARERVWSVLQKNFDAALARENT